MPARAPTPIDPLAEVALASCEAAEARGERLGMVARVKLAQRLVVARHKPQPDSWAEIAVREGMPVRTLKYVLSRYEHEEHDLGDPLGVIRETLSLYNEALETLSETALNADNTSAKVGATRLMLETARARVELLIAIGVIPREVHRLVDQDDAATLVRRMATVIDEYDLPGTIIDRLLDVVDAHAEQPELGIGGAKR